MNRARLFASLLVAMATVAPAHASTLPADGLLHTFELDGGYSGDYFEVFGNGVSLDITSATPASYPASKGQAFDAAHAESAWSHAVFNLPPSADSISGSFIRSAPDDGGKSVDARSETISASAVGVPAAWGLFIAGSTLFGTISRRRPM